MLPVQVALGLILGVHKIFLNNILSGIICSLLMLLSFINSALLRARGRCESIIVDQTHPVPVREVLKMIFKSLTKKIEVQLSRLYTTHIMRYELNKRLNKNSFTRCQI